MSTGYLAILVYQPNPTEDRAEGLPRQGLRPRHSSWNREWWSRYPTLGCPFIPDLLTSPGGLLFAISQAVAGLLDRLNEGGLYEILN